MLESAIVTCPSCWQSIELSLDLSAGSSEYVEDCPVCCQPMRVLLQVDDDGEHHTVSVEAENG